MRRARWTTAALAALAVAGCAAAVAASAGMARAERRAAAAEAWMETVADEVALEFGRKAPADRQEEQRR